MSDAQLDPFKLPDKTVGSSCNELIEAGEKITIRAVARRLGIAHTTLSRDKARKQQIDRCRELQRITERVAKSYRGRIRPDESPDLAKAKQRVSQLETQTEFLIASHKAMILAVGEIGGLSAWRAFFNDYQHVIDALSEMGALPDTVTELETRPKP